MVSMKKHRKGTWIMESVNIYLFPIHNTVNYSAICVVFEHTKRCVIEHR